MRIYTQSYGKQGPKRPSKTPALVLVTDRWNDFGYQTLFNLFYFPDRESEPVEIGSVKILHKGKLSTEVNDGVDRLSEDYCSLGQRADYYEALAELGPRVRGAILRALRDITYRPSHARSFSDDPGFRTSLLRESEASRLYEEATRKGVGGVRTVEAFSFRTELPGARRPHEIDFDFRKHAMLPNRVFALIGKNGTGKTQFLRRLADVASGTEVKESVGQFVGGRPGFRTVVAVSYSAFDDFSPESKRTAKGYAYCGLYHRDGRVKSRADLWKEAKADARRIVADGRGRVWDKALNSLFGSARLQAIRGESARLESDDMLPVTEASLSSGELFLLAMMSRLIGFVRPESLIIMDEPEMHLHPNAIGDLVRTMRLITKEFRSFVIVATHSPLVLQQIPSRYVRVLQRTGNSTLCTRLGLESFGENLTTLTESVFHAADEPQPYLEQLKAMMAKHSLADVEDAFGGKLSYTARSYLSSVNTDRRGR